MSLSPHEYIRHILDEIDFIHDYFGVDYTIVWDVATTKLPIFRSELIKLLAVLEGHS